MGQCDRIVILSDMHMGRPSAAVRSPDMLRPLWEGAHELIVNGDLAEVSDPLHRGEAARQVLRLQELCEADDVHLCLLSGNHDPMISDRRYLRLGGGEILCAHGDILHPAISPWTAYARRLHALHEDAIASLDRKQQQTLDGELEAVQYAAVKDWDYHVQQSWVHRNRFQQQIDRVTKIGRVLWYWHTLPRRAAAFARRYAPESRFFVFGHIHRAGIWRDGGRMLINTGAFDFPGRPRAVVISHDELSVHRIRLAGDVFEMDHWPMGRFSLTQPIPAPPQESAGAVAPRSEGSLQAG